MKPETLDKMLVRYKEDSARCKYLKETIEDLKTVLKDARATMRADAANGVQVLTGMPHGGGVSDPTGRYGALFAEGWVPDDLKDVEREIAEYEAEYAYKIGPVRRIEAILEGLTEKEYLVIYGKYINENTWRELEDKFQQKFGTYINASTLKRINKQAKNKLYRIGQ